MRKELSMSQYTLKFGMVYLIGVIILAAGTIIFDMSHSTATSVVVLIVAAFYTTSEFILDYERVPDKKEKLKLIGSSILMSWFVLLILTIAAILFLGGIQAIAALGDIARQLDTTKMASVFVLISLAYLVILFFSYGKLAQIQYNIMRNKGAF